MDHATVTVRSPGPYERVPGGDPDAVKCIIVRCPHGHMETWATVLLLENCGEAFIVRFRLEAVRDGWRHWCPELATLYQRYAHIRPIWCSEDA